MTFLPIVERELRVGARRRETYWVRAASALGAILIGFFVYLGTIDVASHQFGKELFRAISYLAMFYCLSVGVRVTADCLSEEKREGTLGLLFLTDLKGYDVVLGKLVATSLNALYGLIAIFPILAVPLLLGGIKGVELARMALVLINTFLFSLAVGMFISSLSRFQRKAMAGTFGILLAVTIGLPLLQLWLLNRGLNSLPWGEDFLFGSPFGSFSLAGDDGYVRGAARFWCSLGILHGATWICLILACVLVPRSWQDCPAETGGRRWNDMWRYWNYGDEAERKSFRSTLLDVNAFFWIASRARLKPLQVWWFLALVACVWAWGCVEFGGEWFNPVVYLFTALLMNGVLKYWIASESGRRLGEDRKAGSLELVLSTSLSVEEIVRGQLLALRRQFLWPLVTITCLEIGFLVATVTNEDYEGGLAAIWIAGIAMLILDVLALPWVAMWVAISSKNPNRTTGIAVVRILLLPWVFFVGVVMILGVSSNGAAVDSSKVLVSLWAGLGAFTDALLGFSSRQQLLTNFRTLATERFIQKGRVSTRNEGGKP